MASSVTVPSGKGVGAPTLTLNFVNTTNLNLANQIAGAIANAVTATGGLFIGTVTGGATGSFPTVPAGQTGELIIPSSFTGSVAVPGPTTKGGYSFVIDQGTGDTLTGSPGVSIIGSNGNRTIIDPDILTLGDTAAGSTNIVTITGASDNVAVGNGTNTVVGTGGGTISGGTHDNTFSVTGAYVINSQGDSDSVVAGSGAVTVNLLADTVSSVFPKQGVYNAGAGGLTLTGSDTTKAVTITGGVGPVNVSVTGGVTTLFGGSGPVTVFSTESFSDYNNAFGSGALNATVSGSNVNVAGGSGPADVVLTSGASAGFIDGQGTGTFSVDDSGTNNVIVAVNSSAVNVTLGGSGGAYVGGVGASTDLVSGTTNVDYSNVFGSAASTVSVTGSHNTVLVGNASAGGTVNIASTSGSNFILELGSKAANVVETGSNDFLSPGYAATGSGAIFNTTVSGSGDTVVGGGGTVQTNVTAVGSNGINVINLGGELSFVGGSGGATVAAYNFFGGSGGGTTIFGGSGGSDVTYGPAAGFSDVGAGGLVYTAGTGNETLNAGGSTTSNTLAGGLGNVTLTAGSGTTDFLFDKNVIDGTGSVAGGATDLITNFTVNGANTVDIKNYVSGSASVTAGSGGASLLTLSDGTKITFDNTGTAALSAAIHYT